MPTTESNIWLTDQKRVDRDYAAFGELAFDITPKLTVTGGGRLYKFDNTLVGFFGFANPGLQQQSDLQLRQLRPAQLSAAPATMSTSAPRATASSTAST